MYQLRIVVEHSWYEPIFDVTYEGKEDAMRDAESIARDGFWDFSCKGHDNKVFYSPHNIKRVHIEQVKKGE